MHFPSLVFLLEMRTIQPDQAVQRGPGAPGASPRGCSPDSEKEGAPGAGRGTPAAEHSIRE